MLSTSLTNSKLLPPKSLVVRDLGISRQEDPSNDPTPYGLIGNILHLRLKGVNPRIGKMRNVMFCLCSSLLLLILFAAMKLEKIMLAK
jgi:hypothetical protein